MGRIKGGLAGAVPWLRSKKPDIAGFQEVQESSYESAVSELHSEGYCSTSHMGPVGNSVKGIVILSKHPFELVEKGLPGQEHKGARLLTASVAGLSFTTLCVPGASGAGKLEGKLEWLDALSRHLSERSSEHVPAVLCGDFNINPAPIDNYYCWEGKKENKSGLGFGKDERARIASLLDAGWVDLVRELNPDKRLFSWWYSSKFYDQDKGLRIDHVFGNAAIARRSLSAWIDRGQWIERGKSGAPDHAPVVVDLN